MPLSSNRMPLISLIVRGATTTSPLRPYLASGAGIPPERPADVALALPRVAVPPKVAVLINRQNDMRESANIGNTPEQMLHVLPSIADRVARVWVPAKGAGCVALTAAVI